MSNYSNNGGSFTNQNDGAYPQRGGWYGPGGRARGNRGRSSTRGARGGYGNSAAQSFPETREYVNSDRQRDNAPVNVGVPKAKRAPGSGPPRPQHLSKVASEERNDPLWREAVFSEASADLKPRPHRMEYFVGCEGFTEVVTQSHEVVKTQTPGFSKRVPLDIFQYYNATLLYARLLEIHSENGYPITYEESEFVRVLRTTDFPVLSPIEMYMSGLGNTSMPAGRDVDLRLLDRQYEESVDHSIGWFGQVNEDNHFLYRMYPCLAVYIKRIQASLAYTANPIAEAMRWNLPADIQPIEPDAGLPTTNMMGYGVPLKYGHEQLALLHEIGFVGDNVPYSVNSEIPLLIDVMKVVGAEIGFVKAFKISSIPHVTKGSQGQNIITEPTAGIVASEANVISKNLTKMASSVSFIGGAFKYRVKYPILAVRRTFYGSVYSFGRFTVPQAWADSANRPRDLEDQTYNMYEYFSQEFSPKARVFEVLRHERMLPA